jgi:intracellular sulfur oxidation DsrE/DsrF family protein
MQIPFSLDKQSLEKIAKGVAVYALGSAALGVMAYLGGDALKEHGINNPILLSFIAWVTPSVTKVIKEWMAGGEV